MVSQLSNPKWGICGGLSLTKECSPTCTHKAKNCWELWTDIWARNQAPQLWAPLPSAAFQREITLAKPGLGRGARLWDEDSRRLPSPRVANPGGCDLFSPVKVILIPRHLFLHNFIFLFFPQTQENVWKQASFSNVTLVMLLLLVLFLVLYLNNFTLKSNCSNTKPTF